MFATLDSAIAAHMQTLSETLTKEQGRSASAFADAQVFIYAVHFIINHR